MTHWLGAYFCVQAPYIPVPVLETETSKGIPGLRGLIFRIVVGTALGVWYVRIDPCIRSRCCESGRIYPFR